MQNVPKKFVYDILIEKENLCDRQMEVKRLTSAAGNKERVVLLAPRRYGKTSLVKNIVGEAAKKFRPKHLVITVDLMSVSSLHSVATRLDHALSQALSRQFSKATLLENVSRMLRNLSVGIEINSITGIPSVYFKMDPAEEEKNILKLTDALLELERDRPLVLILDEFQDVGLVPEAEGLLRPLLQSLQNSGVFLLGSKRHLMERMFIDARSPLFHYGTEMSLGPIPFTAWRPYFDERLGQSGAAVTDEGLRYLLSRMCDVPNAVCEVGAWLQERYAGKRIDEKSVELALDEMVESKQGYNYRMEGLSALQRRLLAGLASRHFVTEPTGKDFIEAVALSKSTAGKVLHDLRDKGIVEHEANRGWRLSDPVLAHFIARKRPL